MVSLFSFMPVLICRITCSRIQSVHRLNSLF
nr:MAG TPA: hypothetical protein [Bacteriophage sp.]